MSDDELKKDVLRVLVETEDTHAKGQEELKDGIKRLQAGIDEGRAAREMIEHDAVDESRMKLIKSTFQARNDSARAYRLQSRELLQLYQLGSGAASVAVTTAAAGIIEVGNGSRLSPLLERVNVVFKYAEELDHVREGMKRLRLDEALIDVNRSALSLVDESAATVRAPIAPDSSQAIVTLRDGIKRAIVDLFNRCNRSKGVQESAKTWEAKLRSIFKRTRRDELGDAHYETLCAVVRDKVDEMAHGKDKVTSRLDVLVLYKDRLQFLSALLDGVDEAKLGQ